MGVAASHCPVLPLFSASSRAPSPFCRLAPSRSIFLSLFLLFLSLSLSLSLLPPLSPPPSLRFQLDSFSLSRVFLLLALSFRLYLSPFPCLHSLFQPLASVRELFPAISSSLSLSFSALSLFLSFAGKRACDSLAHGHSLAGPSVLSLRRGCLYSVFHCGPHTCPVAGWPSLACRRRSAGLRAGESSRAPSVDSVG